MSTPRLRGTPNVNDVSKSCLNVSSCGAHGHLLPQESFARLWTGNGGRGGGAPKMNVPVYPEFDGTCTCSSVKKSISYSSIYYMTCSTRDNVVHVLTVIVLHISTLLCMPECAQHNIIVHHVFPFNQVQSEHEYNVPPKGT